MTDLLLSIVLDQSGSMESVRDATIAGINELLRSQTNEDGATYVSLTLFASEPSVRHVLVPLEEVPLLSRQTYCPKGWTALYDAVADSIRAIEAAQERGTELPEKILVAIQTDGYENSSTRISQSELYALVKRKQAQGWAFLFLGCDIDAYGIGTQMGIPKQNTVSYGSGQTAATYHMVSNVSQGYRTGTVSADNLLMTDDGTEGDAAHPKP